MFEKYCTFTLDSRRKDYSLQTISLESICKDELVRYNARKTTRDVGIRGAEGVIGGFISPRTTPRPGIISWHVLEHAPFLGIAAWFRYFACTRAYLAFDRACLRVHTFRRNAIPPLRTSAEVCARITRH